MAHIADLHNNGRCGLHRTLLQARGAYRELIAKEGRALQSSFQRKQLQNLGIRCPNCSSQVTSARCDHCRYFPVPLRRVAFTDPPAGGTASSSTDVPSTGTIRLSRARPASATPMSEYELRKKVDELSETLNDESERQRRLLNRVNLLLAEADKL